MITGWRSFCLVAFAWAFHCGFLFAQQFSQFRGQDGSGRTIGQQIPLEWSEEKNVAWKIKVPGSGWSQPVLWNDRLYLTSAVSDPELKPRNLREECACRKAWVWIGRRQQQTLRFNGRYSVFKRVMDNSFGSKRFSRANPNIPFFFSILSPPRLR